MHARIDGEIEPAALPFFRALSDASRADLLRNAIVHGVKPGTALFEQGDVPNFQLVVLSGSALLFAKSSEGREVLIEVVRPPDFIIPAAVMTGATYLMQARVSQPSRFLLIHASAFRAAVAAEPALASAVIESLAQQFRRMVRQIRKSQAEILDAARGMLHPGAVETPRHAAPRRASIRKKSDRVRARHNAGILFTCTVDFREVRHQGAGPDNIHSRQRATCGGLQTRPAHRRNGLTRPAISILVALFPGQKTWRQGTGRHGVTLFRRFRVSTRRTIQM